MTNRLAASSLLSVVSLISVMASASRAQAQPLSPAPAPQQVDPDAAAPGALGPSAPSVTGTAAAPSSSAASEADANLDRGFLQPTAMTQPAGSITYNNYELLLHGFTYGVTDRVQATLTVLSPIVDDMPFFGMGAVKWRLISANRLHLAVQGAFGYGHLFGATDSPNIYSLGTGAFASFCLRDDCSSLLSATVNYQLAMPDGTALRSHILVYGGSVVHRITNHVKLLGEVTTVAIRAGSDEFDNMPGVLVSYGMRFHSGNIAGDVGFIKPVLDEGDDGLLLGLPFINLSYRWN